jgi:hypothetical protein
MAPQDAATATQFKLSAKEREERIIQHLLSCVSSHRGYAHGFLYR